MKKIIIFLFIIIICMSCSACAPAHSQSAEDHLETIKSFKDEEYGFTLPGAVWGMSASQLDALPQYSLGSLFGSNTAPKDEEGHFHVYTMYLSDQFVELEGNKGTMMFRFADDRLIGASFTFKTNLEEMKDNDLVALYDTLTAQAEEAFGAPMYAEANEVIQAAGEKIYVTTSRAWTAMGAADDTRLTINKNANSQTNEIGSVVIYFDCSKAKHP